MIRFRKLKNALLAWIFLSLAAAGVADAEERIYLTTGEWPPYISEELEHYGVISRIVREAFALEGISVTYGFFPWKRSYEMARFRRADGTVIWSPNTDRKIDFLYSDTVGSNKVSFFYLKKTPFHWQTPGDLARYRLAGTIGYGYLKLFSDWGKGAEIPVELAPSDEMNFRKLLMGRTQVFPCNVEVGYALLNGKFKPHEADRITHHPAPVMETTLHLLLPRNNSASGRRLRAFNRGLNRLKESGKYGQYFRESRQGKRLAGSNRPGA